MPLLYTADDARRLVESAKFPPVGRRGFGSPFAMGSTGGVTGLEYLQQANDALLTIVQIETKEALENVRWQLPNLSNIETNPIGRSRRSQRFQALMSCSSGLGIWATTSAVRSSVLSTMISVLPLTVSTRRLSTMASDQVFTAWAVQLQRSTQTRVSTWYVTSWRSLPRKLLIFACL